MKFDDPDIHEKLDLMDSAGLNADEKFAERVTTADE